MEGNLRMVLGAAVIGIFLGVAGLVFGIISKNKAEELRSDFSEVEGLVEKVQEVEESSSGISATATRVRRELDALRDGTQGALDQVGSELSRLRSDLNEIVSKARGFEEKLSEYRNPSPPAPEHELEPGDEREPEDEREPDSTVDAESFEAQPADDSEATEPVPDENGDADETSDAEVYKIRSGDTLSAVASKYDLSLDRLMEANPDVDPVRLQIGQEIRIPAR